jgi:hypothetical protein
MCFPDRANLVEATNSGATPAALPLSASPPSCNS